MGIKIYKPTSPGSRSKSGFDFSEITETKPYKPLLLPIKKTGGRNNKGRITVWQRGGGDKRDYRIIDFKRKKINMPLGTIIHNIELRPGQGGKLARSAGTFAQLVAKDEKMCHIKLSSSEVRLIPS